VADAPTPVEFGAHQAPPVVRAGDVAEAAARELLPHRPGVAVAGLDTLMPGGADHRAGPREHAALLLLLLVPEDFLLRPRPHPGAAAELGGEQPPAVGAEAERAPPVLVSLRVFLRRRLERADLPARGQVPHGVRAALRRHE